MRMMNPNLPLNALVAVLGMIVSQPAHAQLGFGRIANTPYSGGVTVINNMRQTSNAEAKVLAGSSNVSKAINPSPVRPGIPVPPRTVSIDLAPVLAQAWNDVQSRAKADALAFLDEHDIGGGFRTSRNRLELDKEGSLFVGTDARGLTLRFVLQDNVLSTYLRTPTPLDRDTDPGFFVNFDLEVTIDVDVKNNQLIAGPARIVPNVKPPVGKNVTGALAVAAADLVKTLIGVDFVGKFLNQVNNRDFGFETPLNREFAKLNPVLAIAANGGTIIPGFDNGSGRVTLTLQPVRAAPVIH